MQPSDLLDVCSDFASSEGLTRSCYYEAYVRKYVFEGVGLSKSGAARRVGRLDEWCRRRVTCDIVRVSEQASFRRSRCGLTSRQRGTTVTIATS